MGPETQSCPWDTFICPIPIAIYACPISSHPMGRFPWDSHRNDIPMGKPRVLNGTYLSVPLHNNLCLSHPIPWDDPIGMTFPWTSLLKPYINLFHTVEFLYNGFLCNVNSPMALHFAWSRWRLLSAFQFA